MDKYYTPNLNEFHIGFECEILSSYGWQKGIYPEILKEETLNNFDNDIIKQTKESTFRVKYLDRKDIESLGFELQYPDMNKTSFIDKDIYIDGACGIGLRDNKIVSITQYYHPNTSTLVFTIKNKSELKKLLTQLSIEL